MTELIWLAESPLTMIEGEEIAFSVEWIGAVNLSDPGQQGLQARDRHLGEGDAQRGSATRSAAMCRPSGGSRQSAVMAARATWSRSAPTWTTTSRNASC